MLKPKAPLADVPLLGTVNEKQYAGRASLIFIQK